jgi:BMFP domain-containing protein YqiC
LREHISSLKTIRSSIQNSIVELEPLHNDPDLQISGRDAKSSSRGSSQTVDLEMAVVHQELMAGREENADLRAKVYLLEKEKSSQELTLSDRLSLEKMLREHVRHLQEDLGHAERAMGGGQHMRHLMHGSAAGGGGSREGLLRQRVENLLETLDKVTKNNSDRQKQSDDLMEDLKRANRFETPFDCLSLASSLTNLSYCFYSTLSEALERSKRKYQSKLRKMEQQMLSVMKEEAAVNVQPTSSRAAAVRAASTKTSPNRIILSKSSTAAALVAAAAAKASSLIPVPRAHLSASKAQ